MNSDEILIIFVAHRPAQTARKIINMRKMQNAALKF